MARMKYPARFGIPDDALLHTPPERLKPNWHKKVQVEVDKCKEELTEAELKGLAASSLRHFADQYMPGFAAKAAARLESGDSRPMLNLLRSDVSFLQFPVVIRAIKLQRARLRNAVGSKEWHDSTSFFYELGSALTGTMSYHEAGIPPWFRHCFKLEYKSTLEEVTKTFRKYKNPKGSGNKTKSTRERVAAEFGLHEADVTTPAETARLIMEKKLGVNASTVKQWLKPSTERERIRLKEGDRLIREMVEDLKRSGGTPNLLASRPSRRRK